MERISERRRRLLALLPHLAVLLSERHVSRAAARAGITQPSMSRVLAVAREMFADEILVTSKAGGRLTSRAEHLRDRVAAILREVDSASTEAEFVPARARGVIKLAATDYVAQISVPALAARLRKDAPRVTLEVFPWAADALRRIENDDLQLGLNPLDVDAPRGFFRRSMGRDRYVVAMSAGHRMAARKGFELQHFLGVPHILTAPEEGRIGIVDRALRQKGKRRVVGARVRDFGTALALASATDMLTTVPERIALRLQEPLRLALRNSPVTLPPIEVHWIWHQGRHRDPLLEWVRARAERD